MLKTLITRPLKFIKTVHQRLLSIKESDVYLKIEERNPYVMLLDWLLEILQYGSIATIVYLWWITRNLWLVIPAFGCLRWLWLDLVRNTRKSIKEN